MVLGAVGGIVLMVLLRSAGREGGNPFDKVASELKVIEAGREAREARINEGEEAALKAVEEKYAKKREALDAQEAERIKKYEDDPVALARALERASRR
jgi:hypothetical protein